MRVLKEPTPTERLLRACRGEPVDRPPVWLMRQAGRYLPEYRRVRGEMPFLDFCRDVERAVEVSLQPIELVGSEAVILFSDIFVPMPALGVEVDFRPGPVVAAADPQRWRRWSGCARPTRARACPSCSRSCARCAASSRRARCR